MHTPAARTVTNRYWAALAAGAALFALIGLSLAAQAPGRLRVWSSPTIDAKRSLLYVGTGNTYSGTSQPTADAIGINRGFETLNGIRAGGGAIQGPGPTIAGGMLYLNSGYGDHLDRPGNVLIAFEVP